MMSMYNIYYYIKTNNPKKRTNYVLSLKNINDFLPILMLTFKMQ